MSNSKAKQQDRTKRIVAVVAAAVLGIGALIGSGALGWTAHKNGWFGGAKEPADSGALVTPEDGKSVGLTVRELALSEFVEYRAAPMAEKAFTINATVKGEIPDEKKTVTWSLAFNDPASEWASSKSVEDYVTISPSGNQVTVSCTAAFGEQINVVATSTYNTTVSATAKVDYKEKVEFTSYTIDSKSLTPKGSNQLTESINVSADRTVKVKGNFTRSEAYTIKGDEITVNVTIKPHTTLAEGAHSERYRTFTAELSSENPEQEITLDDFFDKDFFNKLFTNGTGNFEASDVTAIYNEIKGLGSGTSIPGFYTIVLSGDVESASDGTIDLDTTSLDTWYTGFTGVQIELDNNSIVF